MGSVSLLASMRAVAAASDQEAEHWQADEEAVARGCHEPTRLAWPT